MGAERKMSGGASSTTCPQQVERSGSSTARSALRLVKGAASYDPREPEERMRVLFAQESDLTRQLDNIRSELETARQAYAKKTGLMALPRMELLRERFAPPRERRP